MAMADGKYPEIEVRRMTGAEKLQMGDAETKVSVSDFWSWSSSDLLSNAKRGVFAEFLVAADLGIANGVRSEWDAFDLRTESGVSVEVKSAAYIQTWYQAKESDIGFSIAKTRAWDPSTKLWAPEKRRQADVYVFCLLDHRDQATVNPLDMRQWRFFVLLTSVLNEQCGDTKRLSLKRLLTLSAEEARFGEIGKAINAVASVA